MISVLIPVYNNWDLTRACLEALAASTAGEETEVLVVDNASTDATPQACPALGRRLFGERFRYLPQPVNRNFAGANNIAAAEARGDWLFLLNNDTLPRPGWAAPLLRAFDEDPQLGAAGPLLLYPPDSRGLHRVQHLGVVLSLRHRVSHLYEYLPEHHPVVTRPRRLQIITGAAMLIPRRRYLALGGLDEGFVNGFEDVEFCARLCREGLHQRVIPEARIIHLAGQSEGRRDKEKDNSSRCFTLCGHLLQLDEMRQWRADGYQPEVSPWMTLEPGLTPASRVRLLQQARKGPAALAEAAQSEPLWLEGQLMLARHQEAQRQNSDAMYTLTMAAHFYSTPDAILPLLDFVGRVAADEKRGMELLREELRDYVVTPELREAALRELHAELLAAGEPELARQVEALQQDAPNFFSRQYRLLEAALRTGSAMPHGE